MQCWRSVTSRSGTPVPAPTLPAGSRIASMRKPANGLTGCDAARHRKNKKRAVARPSFCWLALAARKPGAEAIECRRRRVVVGYVGAVAEAVPDRGAVDDAARADLADDHDPAAGREDADCPIARAGAGALPHGIGCGVEVSQRLCLLRRRR